jgi:hypothetical protein
VSSGQVGRVTWSGEVEQTPSPSVKTENDIVAAIIRQSLIASTSRKGRKDLHVQHIHRIATSVNSSRSEYSLHGLGNKTCTIRLPISLKSLQ